MPDEAFLHPNAIVEPGAEVGARTRVWAFAHLLPGARVGEDCNICDSVFIEGGARLGNRVTVKCGVQLWSGVTLEDDVFVGPNATFTNDRFPRSRDRPPEFQGTVVRHGASIGANATVIAGATIGSNAMVGAGAVVTRDVPPNAMVTGNPARITGYVSSRAKGPIPSPRSVPGERPLAVKGARLQSMKVITDLRGRLSFGEYGSSLPFLPRRYFVILDVPTREIRGENAHRTAEQFLVCLKGSVEVLIDDGTDRDEVLLSGPELGLYIPPLVWSAQFKYEPDSVLLVLASHEYDAADYIRDYEEFLAQRGSRPGP
jgi:acetyltransferase-like isoleucine patch superfamily enzyme